MVSDSRAFIDAAEAAFRDDLYQLRCEPTLERGLLAMRDDPPRLFCVDLNIGLTMGGFAALMRDPQFEADTSLLAIATPMQFHLVGAGVPIGDVIVPPFDPDELRLRAERILGSAGEAPETGLLRRGELRFLALNPGKAFTREMLLNQVWGYDYYGGSRTVDVHVRRIRAKVEQHEPYIETVRNVGYRFVEMNPPL